MFELTEMKKNILNVIRWIAIFLGASITGTISNIVILGLLQYTGEKFFANHTSTIQGFLYFVWSFIFVLTVHHLAPVNKFKTAKIFFIIYILLHAPLLFIDLPDEALVKLVLPTTEKIILEAFTLAGGLLALHFPQKEQVIITLAEEKSKEK